MGKNTKWPEMEVTGGVANPLQEWLPNKPWLATLKLSELDGFEAFAANMEKDALM